MVPPTAAQPITVAPGSPITFAGSANDDEALSEVSISLRNNTTGERLAPDGSWGMDSSFGSFVVSPPNLNQPSYNWSYTLLPFNVKPGNYSFSVSASDNIGLSTSSSNQGRLTINVQVAGDAPPDGLLDVTGTVPGGQVLHLDLTGTATDDKGVAQVKVALEESDSSRYLQPNGTLSATFNTLNAIARDAGATSTAWTLPIDLPVQGDWRVTAYAVDSAGQQDLSTSGATARYPIYPGDQPPGAQRGAAAPVEGTEFPDGKIFVSGRAEDDQAMDEVEIAIVNAAGQYMSSSGGFTSTNESWRTAFLNSPGTPGSNFSYTTPVIPPGAYTVRVRAIDRHGFESVIYERHATVTQPPNEPPVASFTTSCVANVCSFDARGSTDENATTLTYSWNFGNGSGSGPVPTRTYTGREHLHGDADRAGRVGRHGDRHPDGDDRQATGQPATERGAEPAGLRRAVVQLLGGRLQGSRHRRQHHLPLGLGRRHRREHLHLGVARLPRSGHLHGHPHGDGRLAERDHGDAPGHGRRALRSRPLSRRSRHAHSNRCLNSGASGGTLRSWPTSAHRRPSPSCPTVRPTPPG